MEFDGLSLSVRPRRLQSLKLKWSCDTAAGKRESKSKLDITCRIDGALLKPPYIITLSQQNLELEYIIFATARSKEKKA